MTIRSYIFFFLICGCKILSLAEFLKCENYFLFACEYLSKAEIQVNPASGYYLLPTNFVQLLQLVYKMYQYLGVVDQIDLFA